MELREIIGEAQRLPDVEQVTLIKTLGEGLSPRSLKNAIALLRGLQPGSDPKRSAGRAEEAFYNAVAQHLRRVFHGSPPPYAVFRRGAGGTSVGEACASVDAFLDEAYPNLRLPDRLHFYHLYARTMAGYLQEVDAPVALKSIFNTHRHFPGLVDRAYPGYLGDSRAKKMLLASLRNLKPT